MIRNFFIWMYKITGWSIDGDIPDAKKFLLIVGPHTSFWDFPVGIAAKSILNFKGVFLGKAELFRVPVIGWVLKKMGGIPVIRERNTNMVDFVVDLYNKSDQMVVVLTPEGTRSYVPKWKTGFYYMAKKANVPLVLCGFDFEKKKIILQEPLILSDNIDDDMGKIMDFYRGVKGKHPELGVR
jgi:1-acyl-sn-glycerol-3-phosphate acyltransferase